ncbi:hypothetical protein KK083_03900 [Fulvivirgaceae bacterium PWU4]|uniref:Uncharacterized protein n=1 Tax=Chryseosolibacter histidini TaxID=2782349 RepID=A0AAP2GHG6_9BACT|nr:hypothetical protein [Chryseosolibacter histidini]MBT1696006.1 hypothetical protein [Chryseosolibacter histidini]
MKDAKNLRREVRILLYVFVAGLIVSGITAFPIHTGLTYAHDQIVYFKLDNGLSRWIETVYQGITEVDSKYPFIAYGTDWLAFAHLILAVLFAGIIKDPVRNIWVLKFGLISCAAVFPLAFIAGAVRGIPFFWQLIDCSFGLLGGIILWMCYSRVKKLESTF